MKKTILILFLFVFSHCFSQKYDRLGLNEKFNIPNELNNYKEIRIYSDIYISKYIDVFRMYKENELDSWKANTYIYYVDGETGESETKTINHKNKNNLDYVWLKILLTNISEIPNMNEIR